MGVFCEAYNRGLWTGEVRVVDKNKLCLFFVMEAAILVRTGLWIKLSQSRG